MAVVSNTALYHQIKKTHTHTHYNTQIYSVDFLLK